jgi:drug/metabolite transporter (DMT)-like permease
VIATALAVAVLGERPGWRTAIAAALIFGGLAVTVRPARVRARLAS